MTHLLGGRIPDSLAAVVRKGMSLGRTGRYQSIADFQRDIAYQHGFATSAEKAGKWKRFTFVVRRNQPASLGVAAVLMLSVAFTAKVIGERNRAEWTLGELRGTAPTFVAQSRTETAKATASWWIWQGFNSAI